MFEQENSSHCRARVSARDLVAAWLLAAVIAIAVALPNIAETAKAGAVVARADVVTVLHALPKLLQGDRQT
jgi:hypothetical protein